MKEHTMYVKKELLSGRKKDRAKLKEIHRQKTEYIQHERLAHLLVTLTFALLLFLCLILAVIHTELQVLILLILIMCLLIPYIFHYFFLENTVQEWYRLMDEIDSQ